MMLPVGAAMRADRRAEYAEAKKAAAERAADAERYQAAARIGRRAADACRGLAQVAAVALAGPDGDRHRENDPPPPRQSA